MDSAEIVKLVETLKGMAEPHVQAYFALAVRSVVCAGIIRTVGWSLAAIVLAVIGLAVRRRRIAIRDEWDVPEAQLWAVGVWAAWLASAACLIGVGSGVYLLLNTEYVAASNMLSMLTR